MSIGIADSTNRILNTYSLLTGGGCLGGICGSRPKKEEIMSRSRPELSITSKSIKEVDELEEPLEDLSENNSIEQALKNTSDKLSTLMNIDEERSKMIPNYKFQVTFLGMLKDTLMILNESGIHDISKFKGQIDKIERAIPGVMKMKLTLEKKASENEDSLSENVKMMMEMKYQLIIQTLENLQVQKETLKQKCGIPCEEIDENELEREYDELLKDGGYNISSSFYGGTQNSSEGDSNSFRQAFREIGYQPLSAVGKAASFVPQALDVGKQGLNLTEKVVSTTTNLLDEAGQDTAKLMGTTTNLVGDAAQGTGKVIGTTTNLLDEAGQGTGKVFGAITNAFSAPTNRFARWQERIVEKKDAKTNAQSEWKGKLHELAAKEKYMKKLKRFDDKMLNEELKNLKKKLKNDQKVNKLMRKYGVNVSGPDQEEQIEEESILEEEPKLEEEPEPILEEQLQLEDGYIKETNVSALDGGVKRTNRKRRSLRKKRSKRKNRSVRKKRSNTRKRSVIKKRSNTRKRSIRKKRLKSRKRSRVKRK